MYPKLTIQVNFSYRPDLVLTNISFMSFNKYKTYCNTNKEKSRKSSK